MILSGFKTEAEAAVPSLLFHPTLVTWQKVLANASMINYLKNTVFHVIAGTCLCLIIGIPATYALVFARFKKEGKGESLYNWFVTTILLPPVAVLIPLYLIFNEACKYELFKEIIGMSSYATVYYDANGGEVSFDKPSTNWYFNGEAAAPAGITVLGGKTGTTSAARNCLVLLSSDTSGKSYISVILKSQERAVMYTEMTDLLSIIQK